jgi:rod shape-determining protein MreB
MRSWSRDLAIDLGTVTTRIYVRGRGLLVSEPSLVAVRQGVVGGSEEIVAVGAAAERIAGRTPEGISIVHPVRAGVLSDFDRVDVMLRTLSPRRSVLDRFLRPRVLVTVPLDLSVVERRAVYESALDAGARRVGLVPKVVAAALGAGLPIEQPIGQLVVSLGGGTTEIAVLACGGVVTASTSRVGARALDEALRGYVKRKYNLLIGEQTAERLKIELGTACPIDDMLSLEIRGRDLVSGVPRAVLISSEETREALIEPVATIVEYVLATLEKTPPELSGDLAERGIVMVGGGSLLNDLDRLLSERTGLPVFRADNPLDATVLGAGRILEEPDTFEQPFT